MDSLNATPVKENNCIELVLKENNKKTKDNLCIQGKYFTVTVNSDNPNSQITNIQEKLNSLSNQSNITYKKILGAVLNKSEENLDISESSAREALNPTAKNEAVKGWDRSTIDWYDQQDAEDFSTLIEKTKKELTEMNKELHKGQLEENTLTQGPEAHSSSRILGIELVKCKVIGLDYDIQKSRVGQLHTLLKLHKLFPLVTENDKLKSQVRLDKLLELAILTKQYAVVKSLIKEGAPLSNKHLYIAVLKDSPELIKMLIDKGCDPNPSNPNGDYSLLWKASVNGQKCYRAIRELIKNGADLKQATRWGDTPIHAMIRSDLNSSDIENNLEILNDPNFQNGNSEPLLYTAIQRNYTHDKSVFNFLISHGADVNLQDKEGKTSLHFAAKQSALLSDKEGNDIHRDDGMIADDLIEHGALVDIQDNEGKTPLHEAVIHGADPRNQSTIQKLLDAGADIDKPDNQGNTPLHLAAQNEHRGLVEFLLKMGADPDIRNKEGQLYGEINEDLTKEQSWEMPNSGW